MVARRFRVKVKGNWHTVEVPDPERHPFHLIVDGEPLEVEVEPDSQAAKPTERPAHPQSTQPDVPIGLQGIIESDSKLVRSPMPGRIVTVSAEVGDRLLPGSELCVLETMKMEQSIQISREGIVRAVFIEANHSIAAGDPLIQLD